MVTNAEFLREVFRGAVAEHLLISFPGDPAETRKWTPTTRTDLPEENNNFFCVSSMHRDDEDVLRRVPAAMASLHVLVVDDVLSKLDPMVGEARMGVPTYKIETSPKNEQWGYVLDPPVDDRKVAEGLVNALCRAFTADMAGVNRVARLPVGTNGKRAYGIPSPRTEIRSWTERRFTADELAEKLDARPEDYRVDDTRAFLPPERDVVLSRVADVGLPWQPTRDRGKYSITCPWVSEHSHGRDDGAVYIAPAGFKCWHGHCSHRTFADFREFLGLTAQEIDDVITQAELEDMANGAFDREPVDDRVRDHSDTVVLVEAEESTEEPQDTAPLA